MGLRPSTSNNTDVTIDSQIGTAYDVVAEVADNLDLLKSLNLVIPNLNRYQGANSTNPTSRSDGSPLEDGDYYLNTTSDSMNYYDLAEDQWVIVDPAEIIAARDATFAARDETNTIKGEVETLKTDVETLRDDVTLLKTQTEQVLTDTQQVKTDTDNIKTDVEALKSSVDASKTLVDASVVEASNKALEASLSATTASSMKDAAETLANDAQTFATNAEEAEDEAVRASGVALGAANFKGQWANLSGSIDIPATVEHNGQVWLLRTNLVDITVSEPSSTNSDWGSIGSIGNVPTASDSERLGGELPEFYVPASRTVAGKALNNDITIEATDIVTDADNQFINNAQAQLILNAVQSNQRNVANGFAGLDSSGKIDPAQLPSYVDDVLEYATKAALPTTGSSGVLYIVVADEDNDGKTTTYRWSGSAYALISSAMTAEDIAALYEGLANTNKFEDTHKTIVEKIELVAATPSKAEFMARVESNKRKYKGDGFIEEGQAHDDLNWYVKGGLWAWSNVDDNRLMLGNTIVSTNLNKENSKTAHAVALLGGVECHLKYMNIGDARAQFNLADAPDGTETYNSNTGEYVKHASAAEAFEGEITNGDFRDGANGWAVIPNGGSITIADGVCTLNGTGSTSNTFIASDSVSTLTPGTEYRIEVVLATDAGGLDYFRIESPDGHVETGIEEAIIAGGSLVDGKYRNYKATFTCPTNPTRLFIAFHSGDPSQVRISSISIMEENTKVITSRKDFVAIEGWYERLSTSDKVHAYGCVQSGLVNWLGATTANVNDGYSALSERVGSYAARYHVWSGLTLAQKLEAVSNPLNNIFYDEDIGDWVQFKWRGRTPAGFGDEWLAVRPTIRRDVVGAMPSWLAYGVNIGNAVVMRGARTDTIDFHSGISSGANLHLYGGAARSQFDQSNKTGWQPTNTPPETTAYEGKCYLLPVALVQRLNKGARHPEYNEYGCRRMRLSADLGNWGSWYSSPSQKPTSKSDCFDTTNFAHTNTGFVGASATGRELTDPYLYYNAVYKGQVEYLGLSLKEKYLPELLQQEKVSQIRNDGVRGKGKVPFSRAFGSATPLNKAGAFAVRIDVNSTLGQMIINNIPDNLLGAAQRTSDTYGTMVDTAGTEFHITQVVVTSDPIDVFIYRKGLTSLNGVDITGACQFAIHDYLSTEFDQLPMRNLIGEVDDLAATFPNGCVGERIPQAASGADGDFKLSAKASSSTVNVTYTDNNGVSWTNTTDPIKLTPNTITSTFGNTGRVLIVEYVAVSKFAEDVNLAEYLYYDTEIIMGSTAGLNRGSRLAYSVADVIPTSNSGGWLTTVRESILTSISPSSNTIDSIHHTPVSGLANNNTAVGFKCATSVIEKQGLLYMQYTSHELKYNGVDWGDDGFVYGVPGVVPDTNGNYIKRTVRHSKFPIGVA